MEKRNVSEVFDYNEQSLTKRVLFKKDGSVVFVLNFQPGQELPPHKHPGSQVYVLVVRGSGTLTVDGVQTQLELNDAVRCDGDEQFSFQNTGSEPASLFVCLNQIPGDHYAQDHA